MKRTIRSNKRLLTALLGMLLMLSFISTSLIGCEQGAQGPQGEQGIQGPQGEQGSAGAQGDSGDSGKSAYELYKEAYSYTGTEQEWLNDLVNGKLGVSETYTVTFDSVGGAEVASQAVSFGKPVERPADPTLEGHDFIGWYNGDGKWSFSGNVVTGDMTLTARWAKYEPYTEGLEFSLRSDDGSYCVVNYTGTEADVIIPSVYKGKPVVSVGTDAFNRVAVLKSVYIPASVTVIEDYAFYSCRALETVTLAKGSKLEHIGGSAFYESQALTRINLEDATNLITMGSYVFKQMSVKNMVLPDGLTAIPDNCFKESRLETVVIPTSVTSIGQSAFHISEEYIKAAYYLGTADEWALVEVHSMENSRMLDRLYFYSEAAPAESGRFWHYVDGVPTAW